jgi:hypothetical protein
LNHPVLVGLTNKLKEFTSAGSKHIIWSQGSRLMAINLFHAKHSRTYVQKCSTSQIFIPEFMIAIAVIHQ